MQKKPVHMPYTIKDQFPRTVKILFPICVTVVVSLIAPKASPLIASLMFGNLIRESGAVERLSEAAQNELANLVHTFLGTCYWIYNGRRVAFIYNPQPC